MKIVKWTLSAFVWLMLAMLALGAIVLAVGVGVVAGGAWLTQRLVSARRDDPEVIEATVVP